MSIWFAIFLGFIQGLTEFLPVSSSGHLAIFQNFFGMEDPGSYMLFNVLLHLATLFAVCIFFWQDIKSMVLEFFRFFNPKSYRSVRVPPARRLLLLVIVGTLPLLIFAFFSETVKLLSGKPLFIGIALTATGGLLWLSDMLPKGNKDEKSATLLDVIYVGFMQGIATIPGLSRSGLTISTGMFRGFDRRFAVKLSFLMSVPAILGATVLEVGEAFASDFDWTALPVYLAGMVTAAVTGYLALCFIRLLAAKGSFRVFAYYCLFVGVATLLASLIMSP
ncbi:MAG: undecaprenyl-diphosphate phosphatase [Oscillospiraceae bacterium]|nr:undecaprenyl-diphosphate phosphatase [Oscillospiraceae bacterium]